MGMKEAIKNFNKQFEYEPEIENAERLRHFDKFIVVGLGGSHLAADLLKVWNPYLDVVVHEDYGLPAFSDKELKERLVILSSYSGNTEEALDAFNETIEKKLTCAVISPGGKLIELAKKHSRPYIAMPDTGIQPRLALGFGFKALLKLMGQDKALQEIGELAQSLKPADFEKAGRALAKRLKGFTPVVYSSSRNLPIARDWKINFNETGETPAFYNAFPELNHNEMAGFGATSKTKKLSARFCFVLLQDETDRPRIKKRMAVFKQLYKKRNFIVEAVKLTGQDIFYKIFSSLVLADWAAYYLAQEYGVEAEQAPIVEEFKKLIVK